MQCKKCIYVILQCTTSDRLCNAMQHVISLMNMGRSWFYCAMQCKAKSAKPICYSSMHNVRSSVKCNATRYLVNEHGKELVLLCNAKSAYPKYFLQCTTLNHFCNAMQCNATCYLFNEHGKELVLACNSMQSKKCKAYMLFFNAQR